MQYATRPEFLPIRWILLPRIVEFFWFLLGIEVVQIAEPLIETMHSRQKLVTIA